MGNGSVLVTGGNSGIGLECARALARAGRHVVIASRGRDLSEKVAKAISSETGSARVDVMDLDLASPTSIRRLAADLNARDVPLNGLVCNAGLQYMSGPKRNDGGYELTFAVNHLGHFLLTNLLLSRLTSGGPTRIAIVSSGVHDPKRFTGMPKANVADLDTLAKTGGAKPGSFNGPLAYVNSKLCNLWFAYELSRQLEKAGLSTRERPIAVNSFDPGLVAGSGLARDYPPALRFIWDRALPVLASALTSFVPGVSTATKSGTALAQLILDPRLGGAGARYYPSHTRWCETPSSQQSYDTIRARELWDASIRMSGLGVGESPLVA